MACQAAAAYLRSGFVVVHILWDLAQFYDSVDIPQTIRGAVGAGFPLDVLALGLISHRAPRALCAMGCIG